MGQPATRNGHISSVPAEAEKSHARFKQMTPDRASRRVPTRQAEYVPARQEWDGLRLRVDFGTDSGDQGSKLTL